MSKADDSVPAVRAAPGRMHRITNHLIQLQDLIFARDQQEASMPGTRLVQLEASIQTLLGELPLENKQHFEKMHKKANLVIVPVSNGVCSGCGMVLPVSQVHAIHAAEAMYQCSNCARYLFYPPASPRRLGKKKRRSEPMQVGIARFSSLELMIPGMVSTERDDVIAELCRKMESEEFVDSGDRLIEEALRREAIIGTAVDHGLAFPHVRGVEGGGLTLALGLSRKGIRFGGPSRALTRIVFFIVIPTAASAFYLKLLSGLTQTFREEDARDMLFAAKSPQELWKALIKSTRSAIP